MSGFVPFRTLLVEQLEADHLVLVCADVRRAGVVVIVEVEPVHNEGHLVMALVLLVVHRLTVVVMLQVAAVVVVAAAAVNDVFLPSAEVQPRVVVAAAAVTVVAVWQPRKSDPDFWLPGVDLVDGVWCLVTPPGDGLDVLLCQMVEDLTDVQVLLHGRAEELEAGVARELLDLEAERCGNILISRLQWVDSVTR